MGGNMGCSQVRFQDKFVVNKRTGCWVWTGGVSASGYGVYWLDGKTQSAHRVAHGGDSQVVMHTCDNKLCVNPDHLRGGTYRDNSADMVAKGRSWRAHGKDHPQYKHGKFVGRNRKYNG